MGLLEDKVAVVYGAGGAIGGAVARAFAGEGARVFGTGRRGGRDVAEVDALDEQAVDEHLESIVEQAGRVDISFNAIGIADTELVGVPLVDLTVETFARPVASYVTSYFLTARLAARRMLPNRSGVIMTVSALPARTGTPLVGGYGPAMAAKEGLTRSLSAELAPHGIRVVGLRPHAMPETASIREVFDLKAADVMTWEQWQETQAGRTHRRRLMTLDELAGVAAFVASDRASGLTGTTVNLTLGSLDD